jgi:hypothetical protein
MPFYGIRNILVTTKNLKEDAMRDTECAMGRFAEECKNKTVSLLASDRREKNQKEIKGTGKGKFFN